MHTTRCFLIMFALAGTMAGCSRATAPTKATDTGDPVAQVAQGRMTGGVVTGSLPIALGDHWKYITRDREFSIDSGDTTVLYDINGTLDVTNACPDTSAGHAYVFQTSLARAPSAAPHSLRPPGWTCVRIRGDSMGGTRRWIRFRIAMRSGPFRAPTRK